MRIAIIIGILVSLGVYFSSGIQDMIVDQAKNKVIDYAKDKEERVTAIAQSGSELTQKGIAKLKAQASNVKTVSAEDITSYVEEKKTAIASKLSPHDIKVLETKMPTRREMLEQSPPPSAEGILTIFKNNKAFQSIHQGLDDIKSSESSQ